MFFRYLSKPSLVFLVFLDFAESFCLYRYGPSPKYTNTRSDVRTFQIQIDKFIGTGPPPNSQIHVRTLGRPNASNTDCQVAFARAHTHGAREFVMRATNASQKQGKRKATTTQTQGKSKPTTRQQQSKHKANARQTQGQRKASARQLYKFTGP